MVHGSCGWPLLGVTPMILLVLCLHFPGLASNCIPQTEEPQLEPLPAGVDPYMQPAGILQPQIRPQGQGIGNEPGAYGGTDSGSYGRPGPGSYGINRPGAYGESGPGSYGIDGPGANGGTGTGPSGGSRCDTYEQPGPGSYGIQGPGASGGARPDISGGGFPPQYVRPGAGYGFGSRRPVGNIQPIYKDPGIPFVPGPYDAARTAGHVRVRYRDPVSYAGNAGLRLGAAGYLRPRYKDPSIPYIPRLSELPNHAGQGVPSMPGVSIDSAGGGGVGMGDGAMQGSSNPTLSNDP